MRRRALTLAAAGALLLAGCSAPQATPAPTAPQPSAEPDSAASAALAPVGEGTDLATGLAAPWSVARLDDGGVLVSERDTALIREIADDGGLREVGSIGAAAPSGEGGLLGIATLDDGDDRWLYSYATTADDNRIERRALTGAPGSHALGEPEEVLTGIAAAGTHNGGRIAFGPDGMLYATVGDAQSPGRAQDPESLNGKILRMQPDGSVPDDNPSDGSLVYSLGHRNPQGLDWDDDGTLWAAEFGQDTWDEVNRIEPGANYGWPEVEGAGGVEGFVDPVAAWPTDESSPSGLTVIDGTVFVAGLGGERLWTVQPDGSTRDFLVGGFGRIRDVLPGPDGTLWLLTNNTDGRGEPREGDDRLVQFELGEP